MLKNSFTAGAKQKLGLKAALLRYYYQDYSSCEDDRLTKVLLMLDVIDPTTNARVENLKSKLVKASVDQCDQNVKKVWIT